jgi:hypothetical protein
MCLLADEQLCCRTWWLVYGLGKLETVSTFSRMSMHPCMCGEEVHEGRRRVVEAASSSLVRRDVRCLPERRVSLLACEPSSCCEMLRASREREKQACLRFAAACPSEAARAWLVWVGGARYTTSLFTSSSLFYAWHHASTMAQESGCYLAHLSLQLSQLPLHIGGISCPPPPVRRCLRRQRALRRSLARPQTPWPPRGPAGRPTRHSGSAASRAAASPRWGPRREWPG